MCDYECQLMRDVFLSVISSRLVCLLNGVVCKRIGLLERDIFIFMNENIHLLSKSGGLNDNR